GVGGVPGRGVVLEDPRAEEHLVVHGQPEQHGHQDDRQEAGDRPGGHAERAGQPAPLEDGDGYAEAGSDREQEADGRLDRDDQGPEDQHQQQQRQADDDAGERPPGSGEPGGDVGADRGGTGDRNAGAGGVADGGRLIADGGDQGGGGGGGGGARRDHVDQRGGVRLVQLRRGDRGDAGEALQLRRDRVG